MEASTNKKRVKFKDTKFIQFIIRHKRPTIIIGVSVAVLIGILVPVIASSGGYKGSFEYALEDYKNRLQPELGGEIVAPLSGDNVITLVDEKEATVSSTGFFTKYDVSITDENYYSFYLENHLLGNGFKYSFSF